MAQNLLEIQNLKTHLFTSKGVVRAVDDVSFHIAEREALGLVGESGCGKTMTAFSIMRVLPIPPARIVSGKILYRKKNLLELSEPEMRFIRGGEIGMVFQDPMTFLNPVIKVGDQVAEALIEHEKVSRAEARKRVVELFETVQIPSADEVVDYYPHQLSGGMRQRALIAMAVSCRPSLLIADEPTTALDATVQAQILRLMKDLKEELGTALLMITHDLGIVADICDRVCVMYAGQIVEVTDVFSIFQNPLHPYTKGLLNSILRYDQYKEVLPTIEGSVPDLVKPPKGCRFHPRCPVILGERCRNAMPSMVEATPGHIVRCFLY